MRKLAIMPLLCCLLPLARAVPAKALVDSACRHAELPAAPIRTFALPEILAR